MGWQRWTRLSDFHFHFLSLSALQVILKLRLWPQDDHYVTSIVVGFSLFPNVSLIIHLSQNAPLYKAARNASQAHACTSLPLRGGRTTTVGLHCLPGAYGEEGRELEKKLGVVGKQA